MSERSQDDSHDRRVILEEGLAIVGHGRRMDISKIDGSNGHCPHQQSDEDLDLEMHGLDPADQLVP